MLTYAPSSEGVGPGGAVDSAGLPWLSAPVVGPAFDTSARRASLAFGLFATVATWVSGPAGAADPPGFGNSPYNTTLSPRLDCSPYDADASPKGWVCSDSRDRGDVESVRSGQECYPGRVTMSYYYVTAAGVQKSVPEALVYHCSGGKLDGTFEKKLTSYNSATDKAIELRESGQYTDGERSGDWTFQSLNGVGELVVRTARYERGIEVGASRTTEAGKLTEAACSSRNPVKSAPFWKVDLTDASKEKVALAEEALSACGEWSAARCEDFRKQGLLDESVKCDCDQECARPGICQLEGGLCRPPASDEDCSRTVACKDHGLCSSEGETCVARAEDCAKAPACAEHGLCTTVDGLCVATTDSSCAASRECKDHGRCRAADDVCVQGGSPSEESGSRPEAPEVLGERRSPVLYGFGVTLSLLGCASVVGGIAAWPIFGKDITPDEGIVVGSLLGGGVAAALGGLPFIAIFGRRLPVEKGAPPRAALTLQPVVGPSQIGVFGRF